MHPHIINIDSLEYAPLPGPMPDAVRQKYEGTTLAFIGPKIGAQKLGYNITKVPAGKRAFPLHSHRVNEELFFILEGQGEIRIGKETFPVKKGDFIACPPGGADTAHQIVNTSSGELRYLGVSTKEGPEIAEYPDSGKFGVMTSDQTFRFLGRAKDSLGYWDGE